MSDSIKAILPRLALVKESLICHPLTEDELTLLEKQVGLPLPSVLREYFATVGLFQDLTSYGSSEYEVHSRVEDFALSRQFLLKYFGAPGAKLFPFAGDGAGDEIAVADRNGELWLYFANHETCKITEIGSFADWFAGAVDAACRSRRPSNAQKIWAVQFTFKIKEPEPMLNVLRQFAPTSLGEWSKENVMPSGVYTAAASLTFGERELTLNKSDLRHPWGCPMFSFEFDEPAALPIGKSIIRRLDIAFRGSELEYKLVDYGAVALDNARATPTADDNNRSGSMVKKRSWWKFW